MEVDRLGGIRELLGRDLASRVVRNVGSHIASMIRESDIVSRIEDDRIIAVLPRAQIHAGLRVAENIYRSVEKRRNSCPNFPA